ncbi:MAG: PAS domain S-box protein [Candidatus Obscuribacterales bacterium]|nr:PAS domain S-box protein [Candidatus Obscuribacterales bacterium]
MEPTESRKSVLNLSLGQKGLVLVGLPLLFELIFVGMLAILLRQSEFETSQLSKSKDKVATASTITKLFSHADESLSSKEGKTSFAGVEQYLSELEQLPAEIERLKVLSADNVRQLNSLDRISAIADSGLSLVRRTISESGSSTESLAASGLHDKLMRLTTALEQNVDAFLDDERLATRVRPQPESRSRHLVPVVLWTGTILNVLLALIVAHLFYTSVTARLRVLTDNTMRLGRAEPLRPAIGGSDEIALLDRVFHEMADALAAALRKERAIIENALDVICSVDEDLRFTAVNLASTEVWGYAPEELIGRKLTEFVCEQDRAGTIEATRLITGEKALLPFENRILRKDGAVVQMLWSAYWSATERSMFCVAHDITERKRTEELLRDSEARTRSIIESMPVGLLILDGEGRIQLTNPQMETMFGFKGEELLGEYMSSLFPKAAEFSSRNFSAGGCEKLIGRVREFDAQRKNGDIFPAQLSFVRYPAGDGAPLLINVLDVTERHVVERLKRDFVTTVSHELRTPLTSIRGSLTLLAVGALGPLAEQAHRAVKIAERNCLRLIGLLNDLLDIEKLESDKMEMVFERVSLYVVIDRAVESVRSFADQFSIKIAVTGSDCDVCADADRIIQVLVNLLSNGCKYSPRDATVLVSLTEEKEAVRVGVTDCGRGIPPDSVAHIFERFQQVEPDDAKRRGGTGLGLAICRAIVEQHNGVIGVESQPGQGSTFWFSLPKWGTPGAPKPAEELEGIDITGTKGIYPGIDKVEPGERNSSKLAQNNLK